MSKLMYLPNGYWSPRYDSAFYTVKMEGKEYLKVPPINTTPAIDGMSGPAYYYIVVVYREHTKRPLFRRYSHFKWLLEQLSAHPPAEVQPPDPKRIHLPPGTCPFQWQNDTFAQNRMEELEEFLSDVLARPGYASHPAVAAFLEL
jgi:PX domain